MAGVAGSEPQNISQPVPQPTPPPTMRMPAAQAPPAPTGTPPPQQASADDFFNKPAAGAATQAPSADSFFNSHQQPAGPPVDDLMTRAKASFAANEQAKQGFLQNTYGADKVRKGPAGYEVNVDGQWHEFDDSKFNALHWLAGHAGDATAMGGMLGADVASIGNVPDTLGGSLAGLAFSGAAGEGLKQIVGGQIKGMPQASMTQKAIAMGASGVGNMAGGAIFNKVAGIVAGRLAAGKFGSFAAGDQAMEAANAAADVREAYSRLLQQFPETPALLPNQMNTANPDLKAAVKAETAYPEGRNALINTGNAIREAAIKVADSISNFTGGKGAGTKITGMLDAAGDTYGGTIGRLEDNFMKAAGDQTFSSGNYRKTIQEMAQKLGMLDPDTGKFTKLLVPDAVEASKRLELGDTEAASNIVDMVTKAYESTFNKGEMLTATELRGLRRQLTGAAKMAEKNGRPLDYQYFLRNLRDSTGDDLSDAMGNVLTKGDPGVAAEYATAKDQYSKFKQAQSALGNVIKQDAVTDNTLGKTLYGGATATLDKNAAAKAAITSISPDHWRTVNGGYLNDLFARNKAPGDVEQQFGNYNWTGMAKEWENKEQLLRQGFGDQDYQKMKDFFTVAQQAQDGKIDFASAPPKFFKQFASGLSAMGNLKFGDGTSDVLKAIMGGTDRPISKFFNGSGVQKMMKALPGSDRAALQKVLDTTSGQAGQMAAGAVGSRAATGIANGAQQLAQPGQ